MPEFESWIYDFNGKKKYTTHQFLGIENVDNDQYNQDSSELLRTDSMGINESKYTEKRYSGDKTGNDYLVDVFKFNRDQYSFINGVRDDENYLIIARKGTLDKMAEDATIDPENVKRVDAIRLDSLNTLVVCQFSICG